MKKVYLLVGCFLLLNWIKVFCQMPLPMTDKLPSKNDLVGKIEFTAKGSTGKPTITVPLAAIGNSHLNLNLKLEYDASGIKVDQYASWVGLGWELNAGGYITRIKRGRTSDEHDPFGYLLLNHHARENDNVWDQIGTTPIYTNGAYSYFSFAKSYDMEPDLFAYTFGDVKGVFFFNQSGDIISNTPQVKIVPEFEIIGGARYVKKWTLTTGDGTKYEFDVIEHTEAFSSLQNYGNSGLSGSSTSYYRSAWHLSNITTVDNYVVHFTYNTVLFEQRAFKSEQFYVTKPYPNCIDYYEQLIMLHNSVPVLQSITTEDATIIFNCSDFGYITRQLNEIIVKDAETNEEIRKYSFIYENFPDVTGYSRGAFLKHIYKKDNTLNSILINSFNYNASIRENYDPTPNVNSTAGIDWWGYYNGPKEGYDCLIPTGTMLDNIADYYLLHCISSREPNPAFVQSGILTEIIYPTGGKVVFAYEPNDYSYIGNITVLGSKKTGGGVRVKTISYYKDTEISKQVNYYYKSEENSNLSSGVINYEPLTYFETAIAGDITTFRSSVSVTPSEILYSRVIEQEINNGETIYDYYTSKDYGDILGDNTFIYYYTGSNMYFIRSPHPFHGNYNNEKFKWGLLRSKSVKDKANNPIQEDIYTYTFKTYTGDSDFGMKWFEWGSLLQGIYTACLMNLSPSYIGVSLEYEHTQKLYSGSNFVEKKTTTIYNDKNLVSSISTLQSNSSLLTENYLYPYNYPNATNAFIVDMNLKNIINKPIEIYTVKDNEYVIEGKLLTFKSGNSTGLPDVEYQMKTIPALLLDYDFLKSNNGGLFSIRSYYTPEIYYDLYNQDKLLQYHKINNINTSYIWSYNNTYPIIKAENASSTTLTSAVNALQSNIQNFLINTVGDLTSETQKTQWANFNQSLRNSSSLSGSLITTYTYKPLVGITSETDPSGITTYYEYDSFNRLSKIKDNYGNIIKSYSYKYYND